ncbi:MAG: hypothetical protein GTN49_06760 [candidate division Zixibacteria bacterium]|nr:hypothetical protein [candidate division Zixibacteria bacterium]
MEKIGRYICRTSLIALLVGAAAAPAAWPARDKIINSFPSPTETLYGLTYGGGVLYLGDTLTKMIYRMNPNTGSVMSSFVPSPKPTGRFMFGLAYSSGYLWTNTGSPTKLFKIIPATGSVVSSYTVPDVSRNDGIAADADHVYFANNSSTDFYIYKFSPSSGTVVKSWAGAKYPGGMNIITHVPTSKQVVMNLGNVDGWVYIFDLDGTRHNGEQFKIDAPCPESFFTGDLATRDKTHIFFASSYLDVIYEHEIDWGGQEEYAVKPTSFGRIRALFR